MPAADPTAAPGTPSPDTPGNGSGGTSPASGDPQRPRGPRPRASAASLVLATLAVGYTLWAAQGVILPVLLAMFFALVGNPVIRALRRLRFPRFLAALLVLSAGIAGTALLGQQLLAPALDWMQEAPRQMRELGRELGELAEPMREANRVAEDIARRASGGDGEEVEVVRTQKNWRRNPTSVK